MCMRSCLQGVRDPENASMTLGMLITFQLYWNMMNNAFIELGTAMRSVFRDCAKSQGEYMVW
eukprot:3536035-Amphidinium_carterae.1